VGCRLSPLGRSPRWDPRIIELRLRPPDSHSLHIHTIGRAQLDLVHALLEANGDRSRPVPILCRHADLEIPSIHGEAQDGIARTRRKLDLQVDAKVALARNFGR